VELCVYVDDVDEAAARAAALGIEQVAPPADMPWGERTAWIADPDGNLVMLTAAGT
jgi:lactoylglutathione lyase